MNKLVIKPAKRRFRSNRKQWKYELFGANGEPLDPRETYHNVGDIRSMIFTLRSQPLEVEIHYAEGVRREVIA